MIKKLFKIWFEKKYGYILLSPEFIILCFIITGGILFSIAYVSWGSLSTIIEQIAVLSTIGSAYFSSFAIVYGKNNQRTKNISENYFYKINLLVNVEGLLTSIIQAQSQQFRVNRIPNSVTKEQFSNSLEAILDDYKYWSSQIQFINGNVFAPAEIRSTVSLLLHQGVKPITSISFSLDERFLNNTVIRYFDKIFASDYFSKDNDHEVKHYLNMVTNSKEMILDNVEKMKSHSND